MPFRIIDRLPSHKPRPLGRAKGSNSKIDYSPFQEALSFRAGGFTLFGAPQQAGVLIGEPPNSNL
jgi:hypothetical protein